MCLCIIVFILASCWLTIWLIAELIVIVRPLLYRSSQRQERKESGVKYIVVQMPATILVLLALCRSSWMSNRCLLVALMLKLGLVPLHSWVLQVFPKVGFHLLYFYRTLAKLPSLGLLVESYWLYCTGLLNVLLGAVGGIASADIKLLLSYSRVINTGWLTILVNHSLKWVVYMCLYQFTLLILINYCTPEARGRRQIRVSFTPERAIFLIVFLLSLAGLPPLLGFWYKWLLITSLGGLSRLAIIIISLLLAIGVYFYLQMGVISMLTISLFKRSPHTKSTSCLIVIVSLLGGLRIMA